MDRHTPTLALSLLGAALLAAGPAPTPEPGRPGVLEAPASRKGIGVTCLAFSRDGATLVAGGWDKSVRFWDVATGKLRSTLRAHAEGIDGVALSPDGKTVAYGGREFLDDGDDPATLRVLDVKTGRQRFALASRRTRSVAFSPHGKTLAASAGRTVTLWDADTGKVKRSLPHAGGVRPGTAVSDEVHAVAFSADGKTLVTGGGDRTVRLWDVATGKVMAELKGHDDAVLSVAVAPDGRTLASGGGDGVRLWDAATGKVRADLKGHTKPVEGVAFSPDGKLLATAGGDREVRLWDAATGKAVATLKGHTREATAVAFSPDGRLLASGGHDNTVRLWDVAAAVKKGE